MWTLLWRSKGTNTHHRAACIHSSQNFQPGVGLSLTYSDSTVREVVATSPCTRIGPLAEMPVQELLPSPCNAARVSHILPPSCTETNAGGFAAGGGLAWRTNTLSSHNPPPPTVRNPPACAAIMHCPSVKASRSPPCRPPSNSTGVEQLPCTKLVSSASALCTHLCLVSVPSVRQRLRRSSVACQPVIRWSAYDAIGMLAARPRQLC